MYCMKCGREVENGQVFCPECLEIMKCDPIAMNTAVNHPKQPSRNQNARRMPIHLEEEVKRLERANERMRIWVILLAMAAVLLAMALCHDQIWGGEEVGKNYSVVESMFSSR